MSKPCPCGSGHQRHELLDAQGIFCAFVCDDCEAEKRRRFNPDIFDAASYPTDDQIEPDDPSPLDDWEPGP